MGSRKKNRRKRPDQPVQRPSVLSTRPEDQSRLVKTTTQISAVQFSGPLPPPETLAKFDEIQEGFANRIVAMAEGEAKHRREIDIIIVETQREELRAARMEARLGQIFGLMIGLVVIGAGTLAVIYGHEWSGTIIGGGGVIGLVTAFIIGRKAEKPKEESGNQGN